MASADIIEDDEKLESIKQTPGGTPGGPPGGPPPLFSQFSTEAMTVMVSEHIEIILIRTYQMQGEINQSIYVDNLKNSLMDANPMEICHILPILSRSATVFKFLQNAIHRAVLHHLSNGSPIDISIIMQRFCYFQQAYDVGDDIDDADNLFRAVVPPSLDVTDSFIDFWWNLYQDYPQPGAPIMCDPPRVHPLCLPQHVSRLMAVKQYEAQPGKPILFQCNEKTQFFLTTGDFRPNESLVSVFRFINSLWQEHDVQFDGKLVQLRVLRVMACTQELGCIEFNCNGTPLSQLHHLEESEFGSGKVRKLIPASAATLVAIYVLGLPNSFNRHVFVDDEEGDLFWCSYTSLSHFLEQRQTMETTFDMTPSLAEKIGDRLTDFVTLSVKLFNTLRMHYDELSEFISVAMGDNDAEGLLEMNLGTVFDLEEDEGRVQTLFARRVRQSAAPTGRKRISSLLGRK